MGSPTTDDITVIIATYGEDPVWQRRASFAWYSVAHQSLRPKIVRVHGETLAEARNDGAAKATTPFIIFLDADDTLDVRYVEAMQQAIEGSWAKSLWRPATLGVVDGIEDDEPVMIPRRPLREANFMVIGTMVMRDQFLALGGFRELPVLEDWDLWIRFAQQGSEVMDVPNAIYRVTVHTDSRNQNTEVHHRTYNEIRRTYASFGQHGNPG